MMLVVAETMGFDRYLEVNMNTAQVSWAAFSSLQGFWPGLQATWGDTDSAEETMVAFFSLWTAFGFAPERFDLMSARACILIGALCLDMDVFVNAGLRSQNNRFASGGGHGCIPCWWMPCIHL